MNAPQLFPAPRSISMQILAPIHTGEPACFVDFTSNKEKQSVSGDWISGTCSAIFPRSLLRTRPIVVFHTDTEEMMTMPGFSELIFSFVIKEWRIVILTRGKMFTPYLPFKYVSIGVYCAPGQPICTGTVCFADSFSYSIDANTVIDSETGIPIGCQLPRRGSEVCLCPTRDDYQAQKIALKASFKFGHKIITSFL